MPEKGRLRAAFAAFKEKDYATAEREAQAHLGNDSQSYDAYLYIPPLDCTISVTYRFVDYLENAPTISEAMQRSVPLSASDGAKLAVL